VYTLQQRYPSIRSTTLVVAQRGAHIITVIGELTFAKGYRLVAKERLSFEDEALLLESYGYEV
jgi:hypothetical protein